MDDLLWNDFNSLLYFTSYFCAGMKLMICLDVLAR